MQVVEKSQAQKLGFLLGQHTTQLWLQTEHVVIKTAYISE